MTVRLRGMTWDHPRGYGALAAASRAYAERHDVHVSWERRSLTAFGDEPVESYASTFDLLVIDHPHVPAAVGAGALAPLDVPGHAGDLRALAEHAVGASHRSYAYAGRQWALAIDAAAQVAVHRPDLLADPPNTWAGVIELARSGRVLWPAKPVDAYSSLMTVAAGLGTTPLSTAGRFLDPTAFEAALALLHRLADTVPAECRQMSPIDVAERLAADQNDHGYCPLLFGYTNYSRVGFRPHRLRFVDAPAGPRGVAGALLGGAGIAVSATADPLDAARDFAYWVAGDTAQRGVYFDGGGQPGLATAWDDPRLDGATLHFFSGTRATLEQASVRPRHPRYPEFQNQAAPLVTACLAGELSDTQTIRRVNDLAARMLGSQTDGHS